MQKKLVYAVIATIFLIFLFAIICKSGTLTGIGFLVLVMSFITLCAHFSMHGIYGTCRHCKNTQRFDLE